jgi:cell division inhibitor SepF
MFKKAMLYLGLGSDEDFEALDNHQAREPDQDDERVRPLAPAGAGEHGEPSGRRGAGGDAPHIRPAMTAPRPERRTGASAVRPLPADDAPSEPPPSLVRPVRAPRAVKPHVVSPVSFNDAQEVADHFKRKQPVIINLQQAEHDLMRRLIDFSAGLCYGVGGSMKKAADSVYLLTPADVELSPQERERLQEAGLYDR